MKRPAARLGAKRSRQLAENLHRLGDQRDAVEAHLIEHDQDRRSGMPASIARPGQLFATMRNESRDGERRPRLDRDAETPRNLGRRSARLR